MSRLPDFIVIGAMKGGTTSLHHYLRLHPQLFLPRVKELNFFIEERNWRRGEAWYRAQFRTRKPCCGEVSPNYTAHPRFPGVPARMHALVPRARLIYVLRDPVERMLSNYVHLVSSRGEDRPAGEALAAEGRNTYVERSSYFFQLSLFLEHYPLEQVLVLTQEDLWHRREETLARVFAFLDVDPTFRSVLFRQTLHHSRDKRRPSALGSRLHNLPHRLGLEQVSPHLRYHVGRLLSYPFSRPVPRPEISDELREHLKDRVRDDINELRKLTGQSFDAWSV